ncbi:hypothetical protein ACWDA3_26200 [Nonomuraea rubra]
MTPCPHGMPGGGRVRPGAGTPACPECRASEMDVAVTVDRAEPPPSGPPDLSSLRSALAALSMRMSPERPKPVRVRQLPADELPESALAAHAYLLGRGDAHVWTAAAREKLGKEAPRAEVLMLAAELAQLDRV